MFSFYLPKNIIKPDVFENCQYAIILEWVKLQILARSLNAKLAIIEKPLNYEWFLHDSNSGV